MFQNIVLCALALSFAVSIAGCDGLAVNEEGKVSERELQLQSAQFNQFELLNSEDRPLAQPVAFNDFVNNLQNEEIIPQVRVHTRDQLLNLLDERYHLLNNQRVHNEEELITQLQEEFDLVAIDEGGEVDGWVICGKIGKLGVCLYDDLEIRYFWCKDKTDESCEMLP